MQNVAPLHSSKDGFSAVNDVLTILSGEPVYIYNIVIANNGTINDPQVTVESADGSETYIQVRLRARPSAFAFLRSRIPFIADKGLRIRLSADPNTARADVFVFVTHSHVGA